MPKTLVSITPYEKPFFSVSQAVLSCQGLKHMPPAARVFIKPNIVFWTKACTFPKWGVITTSRVVEDMVVLLKEHGISDITIGEGIILQPGDVETPVHAFKTLGYEALKKHYGVKIVDVMSRPFKEVNLGDGIKLNFNCDILESDFLVDLPVMKAHNLTKVSLGLKNLKGLIDMGSRKTCHNPDPEKNLHYHIARLFDPMPPALNLIDGIYSLERGPGFDGKMRRSNILVASADLLSADLVGAKLLGYDPSSVPHLALALKRSNRPADLSDIEVVGESIEETAAFHQYSFDYSKSEAYELPLPLAKQGLEGIFFRKFDDTICTYCSTLIGVILASLRQAWQGERWPGVEVLTGKKMEPAKGMDYTILIGQCMHRKNRDHPHIRKCLAVKGCPPKAADVIRAFNEAGIPVNSYLFDQVDMLPGFFMDRYRDNPDFDESFFRVNE